MEEAGTSVEERKAASSVLLEIKDLCVYYRTVRGISRAVDHVNLTINRREILGLAGESGCGKTTIASALLRLTRPPGYIAGGQIIFHPEDGEPIDLLSIGSDELRQFRWRHLAYVPQGSMNSLNPVMRIVDQFADVMAQHGAGEIEGVRVRVPELLRQVGLGPHVARMYPHELSGGMKQRVIIAMAISLHPDLVIADEPTTALDVNVQRVIIQTLADLRDRLGMSLIVVTHDMAVHAELADRVAVMYAGRIVEVADVRAVFKGPRHPYTQGLIYSIPKVGGGRTRLEGIAGNAPSPLDWPSGCRFRLRCPKAMPVCAEVDPVLSPLPGDGASPSGMTPLVACHLYPQPAKPAVAGRSS